MYKIKKSYDVPQMELPKCMYRVKPLNVDNINTPNAVSGEQPNQNHPIVNGNPDCTRKPQESSPSVTNKGAKQQQQGKNKRSPAPPAKSKATVNSTVQMDTSKDQEYNIKRSNAELSDEMILKLEARQNEIIKKLTNLRDTINTMNDQFCQNSTSTAGSSANGIRKSVDVVVNADPEKPPYSVLFLVKLLKESYGSSVTLCTHVHSSWDNPLPEHLQKLFNQSPVNAATGETITITVIWKKVADKEAQLMVDPSKQAPIRGEANVARFLSRLLPAVSSINYDNLNWDDIVQVDSLIEKGDLKDLKILENQLSPSSQYLFGDATIADFVCFSKVVPFVTTHKVKPGEFPRVFKWLATCQELGEFHLSL